MNDVAHNLAHVRDRISVVTTRCGRSPEEVTLLAVSEAKPANAIKEAIAAGQRVFDKNYMQEGVDKTRYSQEKGVNDLQWRSIDPLQSNKNRLVAEHFSRCHMIDRLHIAARLSEQCPAELPSLNILVQININDENGESGIPLAELDALTAEAAALSHITLRDLTAIPAPESDYVRQFEVAQQTVVAFAGLKTRYPGINTLSLGISDDMDATIAAGNTMVRVGTAIFGACGYTKK